MTPSFSRIGASTEPGALQCWRPAFHRRRFTSVRQLQAEIDAWLVHYHHRRRNHSDYMRGRTPTQLLTIHRDRTAA